MRIGASFQGLAFTSGQFSSPRRRFPHEGNGSATPSPRMPRLASAMMKMGMEVQNCAASTGLRLGSTWRRRRRCGEMPKAWACSTKSDWRMERAPEQMMRPEEDQPRAPRRANVMVTDAIGETLRGKSARTAKSRNSHGSDRERSVAARAARSNHPPR